MSRSETLYLFLVYLVPLMALFTVLAGLADLVGWIIDKQAAADRSSEASYPRGERGA